MNGGPAVATEVPLVALPIVKGEASKAAESHKAPSKAEAKKNNADRQFTEDAREQVNETISGKKSRGEAMAAMVGHMVTAGILRDIEPIHKTSDAMLKDKKVPKETQDYLVKQVPILDSVVQAVETAECGLDLSMARNSRLALGEDVDIHVLRRQLKISGGEMSEAEVAKLKKDIAKAEKDRSEFSITIWLP